MTGEAERNRAKSEEKREMEDMVSPISRFLCRKRRKGLRRRGKALIIFSRKEGKRGYAMEIRQLKYFLSAAKHLSLATAAQE